MSTAVVDQKNGNGTAIAKPQETVISYVPLGETETVHLTLSRVKQFLCLPTRSGKMPSDEQVVKYMMLCKAQGLNPWVNDAHLVGYDTKDGPQFSLITAHQAFLKRAEASPEFDGIESGVVIYRNDQITKRQGDLILKGETLVGGWARVHRRDRKIPSYDALNLDTFNTNRSRWLADPAGMIVKCAEASALRKAFPSTLAAMYCKEEMDREREAHRDAIPQVENRPKADRLAERLTVSTPIQSIIPPTIPAVVTEPVTVVPEASTEPAAEQQVDWLKKLLGMITRAMSPEDLDEIMYAAHDRTEEGVIEPVDYNAIKTAVEAKRNELK